VIRRATRASARNLVGKPRDCHLLQPAACREFYTNNRLKSLSRSWKLGRGGIVVRSRRLISSSRTSEARLPKLAAAERGRARPAPPRPAQPSSLGAPSRGSDLPARHKIGCATQIPLAGYFSVGAKRAAQQPRQHPSPAIPLQSLAAPEIGRPAALLIATQGESGVTLTHSKQRTDPNFNRYTSTPGHGLPNSRFPRFHLRFSYPDED
jgi:hypothetical protein